MEDEYCIVCAEPLEWVAYAINCGHKDACSKCVARLRFVMKDTRCLLCQQQGSAVVVTRSLGAFTPTIPPQDSDKLKDRARAGELYYLLSVDAYFDDLQQYQIIKALCSYTHPSLAEAGVVSAAKQPRFASLKDLRRHLEEASKLQFCAVCLEGRKVFISEQVLYSKEEMKQHTKCGDATGPLAESGFRGHPQCRFCRRSFYGDNELFAHMQQNHEQCHLCRRARPEKYIYYRDYAELDEHFSKDHFPCGHPACVEAKFVVFGTEQELRKHRMSEHKADLVEGLSRHERRAALTIPINLNYRRGDDEDPGTEGVEIRGTGRAGVTIGGAEGVQSRFAGRGRARGAATEQRQLADAMQASLEITQRQSAAPGALAVVVAEASPGEDRRVFRDEDFPAASSSGAGSSTGAAAAPRWAAAANGGMGGGSLLSGDFPELPGLTTAAKRRGQKKKSLVEQLAAAGGGVRVLHRAENGSRPPAANPAGPLDRFPRLTHSASESTLRPPVYPSLSGDGNSGRHAAGPDYDYEAPRSQEVAPPRPESFPALPSGRRRAAAASASGRTLNDFSARPLPAATPPVYMAPATVPQRPEAGAAPRPPACPADFPSLSRPAPVPAVPAAYIHRSNSAGSMGGAAGVRAGLPAAEEYPSLGGRGGAVRRAAPALAAESKGTSAAAAAVAGGPSDGLRQANKALIERARQQLSEADFAAFKQDSGQFMAGRLPAGSLHSRIEALGLAALVPQLAALCPDAQKRAQLLQVHRDAFQSSSPQIDDCEACSHARPDGSTPTEIADDGIEAAGKAASKPKKVPKFDRLRLTGGDPDATREWLHTQGGTQPGGQAAWSGAAGAIQKQLRGDGSQPRGAWSRQGQLASDIRVVNDHGQRK